MSKQAVETFLRRLDENGELKKELFSTVPAKARDAARLVEFAGRHGFDFTEVELAEAAASYAAAKGEKPSDAELSDEQLAAVAGGVGMMPAYGQTSSQLLLRVNLARPMGAGSVA